MCYVLASGSGGICEVLDINVNVQILLKDTSSKEVARVIGNFRLKKKNLVYLRVIFTFLSPDAVLVGIHRVKKYPTPTCQLPAVRHPSNTIMCLLSHFTSTTVCPSPAHSADPFGAGAPGCTNGWVKCTFNLLWFLLPRHPTLPPEACVAFLAPAAMSCRHWSQEVIGNW